MQKDMPVVIRVKEKNIRILRVGDTDYISLTDIARLKDAESPATLLSSG